jgi:hypothetical protein
MFHFVWGFLFVGNFVGIFLWRGNFWRGFLAEVFGGFWDFWRLGIFGGFGVFAPGCHCLDSWT